MNLAKTMKETKNSQEKSGILEDLLALLMQIGFDFKVFI